MPPLNEKKKEDIISTNRHLELLHMIFLGHPES